MSSPLHSLHLMVNGVKEKKSYSVQATTIPSKSGPKKAVIGIVLPHWDSILPYLDQFRRQRIQTTHSKERFTPLQYGALA